MITIQSENFYDWYPEAEALRAQNSADSGLPLAGLEYDLDLPRYKFFASNHALVIVTARDGAKLVGYHISLVTSHVHFANILFGFDDALVVDRAYRGKGLGAKLIKYSEREWIDRGAKVGHRATRGSGNLFLSLGYTPNERTYIKKLEG